MLNQITEVGKSIQIVEEENNLMSHKIATLKDSSSSDHDNLKSQIAIKETALNVMKKLISKEENETKTLKQVNLLYTQYSKD